MKIYPETIWKLEILENPSQKSACFHFMKFEFNFLGEIRYTES